MPDVDLVVNCYERTYRDVLKPGYMAAVVAEQRHPFAAITVLVNNVDDRADAERLAAEAVTDGAGVTRVLFVEDHLEDALVRTGLSRRAIRRLPHYSDCCLVAVTAPGPGWVCYWDAEVWLHEPHDWITPTVAYMDAHPEVLVGGPDGWHRGLAQREALRVDGDFAVGYGFSDVAFLARRRDLAAPIYRSVAPASWRYSLAHIEPIFEQRVDAHMRRSGRLRATYLGAWWEHPPTEGANYPDGGVRGRLRRRAQAPAMRFASRWAHPAARPWPGCS